jgi:hypothetical protein
MSNRPILDAVEAAFRDLRGTLYAADGRAAVTALEGRPDLDTLQYVGDGLLLALAQRVTGAARTSASPPGSTARSAAGAPSAASRTS